MDVKDARSEILKNLISNTGMTLKAFSQKADIKYTTLRSMIERGIGNASVDNVIKVCDALGITVEELDMMGKGDSVLNKRSSNIEKEIEKIIGEVNGNYAAFDGQGLNDMTQEDKELLLSSLQTSLIMAKRINKKDDESQ